MATSHKMQMFVIRCNSSIVCRAYRPAAVSVTVTYVSSPGVLNPLSWADLLSWSVTVAKWLIEIANLHS